MSKKATTVEEQIELLKSRGMTISNEEKAKEHLLDIGYYRLGFYWYYFQKDRQRQLYYKGTDINDAIDLYYLDVDLRNLLSRYIYRIEVHFRTQVVYYVSNKYRDKPVWFSDAEIVSYFNKKICKNLKENNNNIIRHHYKYPKDTYAPAWKTLEFYTFGQILHVFNSLKDVEVKNKIANVYGLKSRVYKEKLEDLSILEHEVKAYECLHEYLVAILNIRNICSHSGVLFDYRQQKGIKKIPDHRFRPREANQTNLNTSIYLILFMLSKVSCNRAKDLKDELLEVFKRAIDKNEKLKNIIIKYIGFELK